MIRHHPSEELLFDYATGALREPQALAIAAHAALCPACRADVEGYEAMGGSLLAETSPVDLPQDALDRVFARIERPEPAAPPLHVDEETRRLLPSPLWRYVGGSLTGLNWRRRGGGVESAEIPIGVGTFITRLLRIAPGRAVPAHTHDGIEYTLVLQGGYHDGEVGYGRGDFQFADRSLDHKPIADPGDPCLCLAVLDAPMRLTGKVGRLINPFVRL
jgi:putative transcriptional regulator